MTSQDSSVLRRGWPSTIAIIALAGALASIGVIAVRWFIVHGYIWYFAGFDYEIYRAATLDWLAGRGFYEQYQLAGPYEVVEREILYPPPILLALVPAALFPPLTWIVPLAVIAGVVVSWRPSLAGWALIAWLVAAPDLAMGYSHTINFVALGNPGLWAAAAIALATRVPAAAVFVLMKPTLAPFALVGIWHRSWWIGLAVLIGLSLIFVPMWFDYVTVLSNARYAENPLAYSIEQVPLMLIPIVAWATRTVPLTKGALSVPGRGGGGSTPRTAGRP